MTHYGGGAGSGRFGGSDDSGDSGTDTSDPNPSGRFGDTGGGGGPPEDDNDGGANPPGRFGDTEPTTVRRSVDVSTSVGSPGGIDAPEVSGTTAVEEVGRTNLGADPGTFDTQQIVDNAAGRIEDREPGRAADTIDTATDAIAETYPLATGAVDVAATSLRTPEGVGPLPGRQDVRAAQRSFEGPRRRIDRGISNAVDRTTLPADRAPLELSQVPEVTGLRDPATTAAVATLGTEAGLRGAEAGIERGLQNLNPAAVGQDAVTFADAGVRGTDRVLEADEEQIQTGLDVGEAAGETAVDNGPALGTAAVADDPSRAFEAPATVVTTGAAGAALGTGAAAGASRTARTAGRLAPDADTARRFLDDDRGALDGAGRQIDEDDTVEIGGDEIVGRIDEPDQTSIRPEFERGPDVDAGDAIQRRRDDRVERAANDDRGDSLINPRSPGDLEDRLPGGSTPRDPLDTRGGRQPTGTTLDDLELGAGTAATSAALTGLGEDPLGGTGGSTTGDLDGLLDAATGATATDTDVGVGPDNDTTPTGAEDVAIGGRTAIDTDEMLTTTLRQRTAVQGRTTTDTTGRTDRTTSTVGSTGTFDGFTGPTIGSYNPPRPPRPPDIPLPGAEDSDPQTPDSERSDALFESGIGSSSEVAPDVFNDGTTYRDLPGFDSGEQIGNNDDRSLFDFSQ